IHAQRHDPCNECKVDQRGVRRQRAGVMPMRRLKARWKAASDWYPTAAATAAVDTDGFLNSRAAKVIRTSVNRSLAERPNVSWKCRARVARDIWERRASSDSVQARAGS